MVSVLRPQPDARSIIEPQPPARLLLLGNLQPFATPDALDSFDNSGNWERTNVNGAGHLLATYDQLGLHFQITDPFGTRRVQTSSSGVAELTCENLHLEISRIAILFRTRQVPRMTHRHWTIPAKNAIPNQATTTLGQGTMRVPLEGG